MDIYFDNSSTTQVDLRAIEAMVDVMSKDYGNPSSLHRLGMNAENLVKEAREIIAKKLKVPAGDIYFTSGGTESNNLTIMGACNAFYKKGEIITTKVEHKSVLECFKRLEKQGFIVKYLDVDENCRVSAKELNEMLNENTQLVSIMHVNNEVGTIEPVKELYDIVKANNPKTIFHIDNIQGFCKVDLPKDCADMISVSSHKIHGPKGTGAVYIKNGIKINTTMLGGGQEKGIRNGTENVPGIVGFAKAVTLYEDGRENVLKINNYIRKYINENIDNCIINSPDDALPYILNIAVKGLKAETVLHILEQDNVFVSSGSACSSNKPQLSHVLLNMGIDKKIVESSIRLSFSYKNTFEQAEKFCEVLKKAVDANKSIRRYC